MHEQIIFLSNRIVDLKSCDWLSLSQGIGEPPLLTSNSVFFALKEAIASARVDAGLPAHFRLNSPATVSKILLATHSAEL